MVVEKSCTGTPSQQVLLQIDHVAAGNLLCAFDWSFRHIMVAAVIG